jgi:hypothetical protein
MSNIELNMINLVDNDMTNVKLHKINLASHLKIKSHTLFDCLLVPYSSC